MKRFFLGLTLSALILPCGSISMAAELIKKGELLTLERAVVIAAERHPSILGAKNSVDAAASRVGQAQAGYYPQVDMSAGYTRIKSSSSVASGSLLSASGSFDQYTGSLSVRQTLFDFGKTKTQVDIQDLNLAASRDDVSGITDLVVFNVKQAYFNAVKTNKNREVARETVGQYVKHLEQARGFFEVGTKPRFDVTKAEVDLSNAKLNLIRAENSYRVAVASLNNALGFPDAPEYMLEDALPFQKYAITFEEALDKAYKNRPDLTALLAKKAAAEKSVELAKKGYYPFLSGAAAYTRSGEDFPLREGWSAGATISVPIFSGFLTKKQVEEAAANLNVIKASEETLRQNMLLEVRQDYLSLAEAEERIGTAELTVRQARENFEIANGRYDAGVGSPIEVTDAEVSLSNARLNHIQALFDYRVARAAIEKAMGAR